MFLLVVTNEHREKVMIALWSQQGTLKLSMSDKNTVFGTDKYWKRGGRRSKRAITAARP